MVEIPLVDFSAHVNVFCASVRGKAMIAHARYNVRIGRSTTVVRSGRESLLKKSEK